MAYLTRPEFAMLSIMPAEWLDGLEQVAPGWIAAQFEDASARIDSRLRKRYAAPFSFPYPQAVQSWLARIVTYRCFLRRGVNQTDEQFQAIQEDRAEAEAEIKEAADSEHGLFDLPLRADTTASGISRGGPRSYSEQGPYVGFSRQSEAGREEDRNGEGTYVR